LVSGNGVVLTATWLLPVALFPSSWDAGDLYGPRLASQQEKGASHDINTTEDNNATKFKDNKGKQKQVKRDSFSLGSYDVYVKEPHSST
jgi:hypothetical protein